MIAARNPRLRRHADARRPPSGGWHTYLTMRSRSERSRRSRVRGEYASRPETPRP
jgi:hypothetical protein